MLASVISSTEDFSVGAAGRSAVAGQIAPAI
jgi:hypothetical protein